MRVGVDLPEDALPCMLERAEVMFPVRVVVRREVVEQFHLFKDGGSNVRRQSGDPLGLDHAPRYSHGLAAEVESVG